MNFNLIPLYNPSAILNSWAMVNDGVEEILKYTTGDASTAKLLNDLLAGSLLMWIGLLENKYIGFLTTRIDNIPTCYKALSIVHLYTKPNIIHNIMLQGMDELNKFAKEQGCTKFRMWTVRDKAFEKMLTPDNWQVGYCEFLKEVI